jgi:hypothetical protein
MKINKNHILKFLILVLYFNMTASLKLEILNKNPNQEYSPEKTPDLIKEMFKKIKRGNGQDSDIYFQCLNLMTKSKNAETMKTLWDNIKRTQTEPQPGNIKREFFSSFIRSTPEQVTVEDVTKDCSKTLKDSIMEKSELENSQIQKELKDMLYPYFARPNPYVGGKNIITAFTGVHRDSMEARELIPKLNAK